MISRVMQMQGISYMHAIILEQFSKMTVRLPFACLHIYFYQHLRLNCLGWSSSCLIVPTRHVCLLVLTVFVCVTRVNQKDNCWFAKIIRLSSSSKDVINI